MKSVSILALSMALVFGNLAHATKMGPPIPGTLAPGQDLFPPTAVFLCTVEQNQVLFEELAAAIGYPYEDASPEAVAIKQKLIGKIIDPNSNTHKYVEAYCRSVSK